MDGFVLKNLSLEHTVARELLETTAYPHDALSYIKKYIIKAGEGLDGSVYEKKTEGVWIAKNATVAPSAVITAPCIIGENTEVRHCAYIRGSVIIGNDCVIGNSTEIKNSVIFDGVQIPHYNYIGDSVLGYKAHFGAGAITSNVKSDKSPVTISYGNEKLQTDRKKIGAIVGDGAEIGCNAVLNPGTVIGKGTRVYPLSSVRGYLPPNVIRKSNGDITPIV